MLIIRLRPGTLALALAAVTGLWVFSAWIAEQPPLDLGTGRVPAEAAAPALESGSDNLLVSALPGTGGSGFGSGSQPVGPGGVGGADGADDADARSSADPASAASVASSQRGTQTYVVQKGDTLSGIARRFQVTVSTLAAANSLADPNSIRPGQQLTIPVAGEVEYLVAEGDTLWDIAIRFGLDVDEVANLNDLPDVSFLTVGQTLRLPVARSSDPHPEQTLAALSGGDISAFTWPILGRLTSTFGQRWGRMHTGIDIAGNMGDAIKAAKAGTVNASGRMGGYGLAVKIDHPDGTSTLYAHASKLLVKKGQKVKQGQSIALVGSTGNSTGPHLHFEVIVRSRSQDPLAYLPKR